jgi:membrane protein implicated in regulation of membrane protease activity
VEGSGATPGSSEQSLFGVMPDVVKGLKDKPPLLFGIGAGVILVAVLGATADVWLVLIVAAVLVLALGAWLVNDALKRRDEARAQATAGRRQELVTPRLKTGEKANVGVIEMPGETSVEQVIDLTDAEIGAGSSVGVVRESDPGKPRKQG